MENVVYINKSAKSDSRDLEVEELAAQVEDSQKCITMKHLITVALAPYQPKNSALK